MPLIMQAHDPEEPTMQVAAPVDPSEPADIPDPVVPETVLAPIAQTATVQEVVAANGVVSSLPDNMLPLAHGFCDYVQSRLHNFMMQEHHSLMQGMNTSLVSIRDWAKELFAKTGEELARAAAHNEHAEYSFADALSKVVEQGIPLMSPPYQVVLHVRSPQGMKLTLTVTKPTAALLVDDLERLSGWLQANGYTPDDSVAVAA